MSQILQPYRVPVAYGDLSQAETLKDVFFALENLSGTIDDIFNRMEKRIQDERKRVDHIRTRVSTCKNKVELVKGSNQATTVFSTAKFPAPKLLPAYPTLFSQLTECRNTYREVDDEFQYVPADPNQSAVGNKELTVELQDLVQRLNTYNTDIVRVEFIMEDNGLGPLPQNIPSVGSMLLFNSDINPYKDYQTLDNLISAGRQKTTEEETLKALASAPQTLISGDALPDIQALDLLFKPSMGEMSTLALPENLPLDFLANISFTGVDLPSIAPSNHNKANYNLPQITDGGYSSGPSAKQPKNAPPPAPSSSGPPPPPPPSGGPPPPVQSSAPPPPPPPSGAPLPPPPAPPSAKFDIDESNHSGGGGGGASAPPAGGGGKPSFLDAIKGMSVDKLRNKEESAVAAKKVQKKVEQAKPLTMAEALKERLARRNEAISGKTDKDSQRRDSLIVAAARNNATAAAPKNSLKSFGFASVEDNSPKNGGDDDSIGNYATRSSFKKSSYNNDDDDSDSDISSFSEGSSSVAAPSHGSSKKSQSPIPPPGQSAAAPVPAVSRQPSMIQIDAPRGNGGLLDSSNTQLSSMLSKAGGRKVGNNNNDHGSDSDSGSDGDNDDDWD